MNKKLMKVFGTAIITGALLAGCSQKETNTNTDEAVEEIPQDQVQQQSTEKKKVISKTDINQTFDVDPFKVKIESISLVNVKNVSEETMSNLVWNGIEGVKEGQKEFNYMDIKYHVENTSDETFIFTGLHEVTFAVNGKQEQIRIYHDNQDFILDDEDNDGGEYLGGVNKNGEVGVVVKSNPKDIKHIRMIIGHSMQEVAENEYDGGADEQTVEFDLK
jgi:hypothetical protein